MADVPHLPSPTRWSVRVDRGRRHGIGPHRTATTPASLVVRLTHTRADEGGHAAAGYALAVAAVVAVAIAPWLLVIVAAFAFPLLTREPGAKLQDVIDLAADRDVIRVVQHRREHRLASRDIASVEADDGRLDAILGDGTRAPIAVVSLDAARATAHALAKHLGVPAKLGDGRAREPAQIEAPRPAPAYVGAAPVAPGAPTAPVAKPATPTAPVAKPATPAVDCTRCRKRLDLRDADRERLTLDCAACGAVLDVSRHADALRALPPANRG